MCNNSLERANDSVGLAFYLCFRVRFSSVNKIESKINFPQIQLWNEFPPLIFRATPLPRTSE